MPGQPSMFELPPSNEPEPTRKRGPSVTHGVCSKHPYELSKTTGLVAGGIHLYWRPHTVRVGLGTGWRWCLASDAPLCRVAAREVPGMKVPVCPCGNRVDEKENDHG